MAAALIKKVASDLLKTIAFTISSWQNSLIIDRFWEVLTKNPYRWNTSLQNMWTDFSSCDLWLKKTLKKDSEYEWSMCETECISVKYTLR